MTYVDYDSEFEDEDEEDFSELDFDEEYITKEDARKVNVKQVIDSQILDSGTCKHISTLKEEDMPKIQELFDVSYLDDEERLIVRHWSNNSDRDEFIEDDYDEDNNAIEEYWSDWYHRDSWFIFMHNGKPMAIEAEYVDDDYLGIGEVSARYVYDDCEQNELYVVYK